MGDTKNYKYEPCPKIKIQLKNNQILNLSEEGNIIEQIINLQVSENEKVQTNNLIHKNDEELATISYSQTSSEYASAESIQL